MTSRDDAFEEWIERARKTAIRDELERRGLWSRTMLGDAGNPCPGCGGNDRFAVNLRKNVFLCRFSGAAGDAIAFVRHVDDVDFVRACEILNREPAPARGIAESEAERAERARRAQERASQAAKKALADVRTAARFRERQRKHAYEIWRHSKPIAGTIAQDYLSLRGVGAPPGARLRYHPSQPLWDRQITQGGAIVHRGPALVAAIGGPDGKFAGVEIDWIDLDQPKGRAHVVDAKTGEMVPSRKTRGLPKGGSVLLAAPEAAPARRLILGEGKITVLSVHAALLEAHDALLAGAEFRAALALGNLAGRAAGSVKHPTLTRPDVKGRVRALSVPNDELVAFEDDAPMIAVPETIEELILLGDGDSDPFATRLAMARAAKRFARAYPWLVVRTAWPRGDVDYNDRWLEIRKKVA